ncbi:unnamed protein product [Leptidea sinapis]|uniref:Headcase middle domain-containing protein n=1 Tax=Leptidea sinapis TaxID=189913 RepID=A0A5E4QYE4_9NEOP|nr:unnamed protein product [Leptidea sinapis]
MKSALRMDEGKASVYKSAGIRSDSKSVAGRFKEIFCVELLMRVMPRYFNPILRLLCSRIDNFAGIITSALNLNLKALRVILVLSKARIACADVSSVPTELITLRAPRYSQHCYFYLLFKAKSPFCIPRAGAGANGIFSRRLDFSTFNLLPKYKVNSYQIKSLVTLKIFDIGVLLFIFTSLYNLQDYSPLYIFHGDNRRIKRGRHDKVMFLLLYKYPLQMRLEFLANPSLPENGSSPDSLSAPG